MVKTSEGTKSPLFVYTNMDLNEKIGQMAVDSLTHPEHFVVEVLVSGNPAQRKIKVVLDGDQGITIEDCARISRSLSAQLDELDLIAENFTLEVSTPGLDQSLKLKRQYTKNIGRKLKIVGKDKIIVKGTLTGITEDTVHLVDEENGGRQELKKVAIPFEDIDKAFVQISFK